MVCHYGQGSCTVSKIQFIFSNPQTLKPSVPEPVEGQTLKPSNVPLHRHDIQPDGTEIGLWHIEEDEAELRGGLNLHPVEAAQLSAISHERRRVEWLAGRRLLHHMSGRAVRGACLKDAFGKPYLYESRFHISLSHSGDFAAVIAGPSPVGIDIQRMVPRIGRIADRFITEAESSVILPESATEHQHVYWCAKEALYKAYGRKLLDARRDMHILPKPYREAGDTLTGEVRKGDFAARYTIQYRTFYQNQYMLAWAAQTKLL